MARRQRFGDPGAALEGVLTDAVASASDAAGEAALASKDAVSGRGGIRSVFTASRKAVAGAKPGDMSRNVFDAAFDAAERTLDESVVPSAYERMHEIILSLPDRVVWMAARQAAGDVLYAMPAGERRAAGDHLLDMMREAASDASGARLEKEDGERAVRAASKAARDLADDSCDEVSEVNSTGVSAHAATVAVFEVGIRGTPPDTMADALEETCRDLPESARRHDDMTAAMVVALSTVVAVEAAGQTRYQTAVRVAEKVCRKEAAERILETISEKTFVIIYGALAACAHSVSNGRVFESGYEAALAAACGVDPPEPQDAAPELSPQDVDKILRTIVPDIMGQMPKSVLQEIYQKMPADVLLSGFEEDDEQKTFDEAVSIDYKGAAADPEMADIISLYEMAYGAGCEGAAAVAKSRGVSRQTRLT